MDTDRMIRELRRLAEKHKNDRVDTFETNWSAMCTDVANRLEDQQNEINDLQNTIKEFNDKMLITMDYGK